MLFQQIVSEVIMSFPELKIKFKEGIKFYIKPGSYRVKKVVIPRWSSFEYMNIQIEKDAQNIFSMRYGSYYCTPNVQLLNLTNGHAATIYQALIQKD
jgi:hypothetical protein